MLIDLSIVILVSILYYLLCSRSRIINLIVGMLLIFIFCWAVGVNIVNETELSELEFLIIVIIINAWITIHSHHLVHPKSTSRMNRFHHQKHNDHIYTVRNRLNNFRLKGVKDRFKATPEVYLHTIQQQVNHLNRYVQDHSTYHNLNQLITSFNNLQSKIDNINYHLDLPMQINFPHGLKRLTNQYRQILNDYHQTQTNLRQDQKVVNLFNHGMPNSPRSYVYLHVNLRFPYQRLIHDRIKHLVDLLVINNKGVFAFTLLNCDSKALNLNQADQVSGKELANLPFRKSRAVIDLKNKINVNYDTVDYLIPNKFNLRPQVGIICTNPKVTINVPDPKFKVLKPQELNSVMGKLNPVLNERQVKEIADDFRDCTSRDRKYQWKVFSTQFKKTITDLLWYQNQVDKLDHKLTY